MNISKIKVSEHDRKLVSDFMGDEYPLEIDFNWLMPVVEKIDSLTVNENAHLSINGLNIFSELNTVWLAVIEFIKWYNLQKK